MKKIQHFKRTVKLNNASSSPNYCRWGHMRHRCYVKTSKGYKNYGEKGVTIQKDWLEDFFAYETYILSLPNANKKGYTVDRIDPYGNYEEGNIRWANKTLQAQNCRLSSNNKSGVVGVSWCKQQNQWRATITVNRKSISIGRFGTLEEAVKARDKAEKRYKFYKEKP